MENADYSEFSKILIQYYKKTPSNRRTEFMKKLEETLGGLICRNVREGIPAEPICPRCSRSETTRYGHAMSGKQRYRCADCERTYTADSCRNLISNSKLPVETWSKLCGCFVNLYSLRKCARVCGVSLYTSFFMRRRLLEILFQCLPPFRAEAGARIQLDEIYTRESFKGSAKNGRIPRESRKRGCGTGPGLNNGLKCIVTGINDAGDMFFDVAGNGKPSCQRMKGVLEKRIRSGVFIITDRKQSYRSVLKALGVGKHLSYDDKDHGHHSRIDSYHSRIRHFHRRFKGVSSRWLMQYLGWQKLIESFKDMLSDRFILEKALSGNYRMTRSRMYMHRLK